MNNAIPLDLATFRAGQISILFHVIQGMVEKEHLSPQLSGLIGIASDMHAEVRESLEQETGK